MSSLLAPSVQWMERCHPCYLYSVYVQNKPQKSSGILAAGTPECAEMLRNVRTVNTPLLLSI